MSSTCAMMRLSSMRTKMLVRYVIIDYQRTQSHSPKKQQPITNHNETFVMADKLDWTEIFEERNHPTIPDMTPIPFAGEREEFDVNITQEEINTMKDSK